MLVEKEYADRDEENDESNTDDENRNTHIPSRSIGEKISELKEY